MSTEPRCQTQNQALKSITVDKITEIEETNNTVTNETIETNTSSLEYIEKCNIRWKRQPFVPPNIVLNKPIVQKIIKKIDQRPFAEVRNDNIGHLPDFDNLDNAIRCKYGGCKLRSHVYCEKCKVHLCFTRRNKCFTLYHKENEVPTDLLF